eukprot:CAMPEP_0180828268 /NCGR_PEP_ID=MMETSP1038_2-20121128/74597_1 /TAXON_ID=632150 /ORGANISM="Azadinium spinosum, Strain 3D9" /LENGTH=71 /DNA_ID=CAMNT_0022871153 /DNA_START=239 /DNA_END=450 /DNA_ORIENTATION=+
MAQVAMATYTFDLDAPLPMRQVHSCVHMAAERPPRSGRAVAGIRHHIRRCLGVLWRSRGEPGRPPPQGADA